MLRHDQFVDLLRHRERDSCSRNKLAMVLWRIMGVSRLLETRNDDIRQALGCQTTLLDKVVQRRLWYVVWSQGIFSAGFTTAQNIAIGQLTMQQLHHLH